MTKPRYYIQKQAQFPEMDLWAEMEDVQGASPKLHIFGCYEGHPTKVLTLSVPCANRMVAVVHKFNAMILDVRADYKAAAQKQITDPETLTVHKFAAISAQQ